MAEKRMSCEDLAAKTGLSRAHLNQLKNGKIEEPKLSTLQSIANALEIPLSEIIREAA